MVMGNHILSLFTQVLSLDSDKVLKYRDLGSLMNLKNFIHYIIIISMYGLLYSCETKVYESQSVTAFSGELNEGKFSSSYDFSGVTSVTDTTDTTINVNWTEINSAKEYYIYQLDSGTPHLIARVTAPASTFRVEGLNSGEIYSFQVRVRDNEDLLDNNEMVLSSMTLANPEAPYFIYRVNPTKQNDIIRKPKLMIFGVNSGDTVKLYSDGCTTKVAEGIATDITITLESSELVPGVTYNFHSKRTNKHLLDSACSSVSTVYNLKTCPDGYILIPENLNLGVKGFCAMKYEARPWSDSDGDNIVDTIEVDDKGCMEVECTTKNWGTSGNYPGSHADGMPWRMLNMETAKAECQSLGENYDLISNIEWMTIAENLEGQNSNWSGALVGNGCLFRGNNGIDDACGYNSTSIEKGLGRNNKASLTLSNGEVIWDFSGNVAEWTDWGKDTLLTKAPNSCTDNWGEIDEQFCLERIDPTEFMPSNPLSLPTEDWNSSYGLGQIEGGGGGHAVRGGSFQYGLLAGVFSLSLAQTEEMASKNIGFRCVYRVPENL